ncbi:MAG: tRNA (guanosine(37)-N1)-methyltransferase TrmD [Candidatus Calescibacterium sp.]|nr:tRNA (guanosine(37)-N1)-methyltransferase TrmD [Candidatus Calescibacterium sp.]MCX7734628.1 tRNA (guanosine(37)-N1)-methyltransferase TrmD [bacterium]MDW8087022.1 tRNA (guanosine(37)-N1)-methyltransferase TrmD [Candidatus Calescibacterium sp.]
MDPNSNENSTKTKKIKFHIITVFPEFFSSPLKVGLMEKAIRNGIIDLEFIDLKKFDEILDDRPYGGGQGMILKIEPIVKAIRSIKPEGDKIIKIITTPSGSLFNQKKAQEMSGYSDIVIVCGRYEGIDARVIHYIDDEISIGDYVIHSGETAALVIIESVARLLEGFKSKECTEEISLNLLGYPQYTRPREFEGYKVPDILLSGNHKEIRSFRIKKSIEKTIKKRPDLVAKILHEIKKKDSIVKEFLEGKIDESEIKKILEDYFEKLEIKPDPFI